MNVSETEGGRQEGREAGRAERNRGEGERGGGREGGRERERERECVVFLSCPLVKKRADLSGSFLYSQSTMKDMYSKPTNRTELSNPMKTKSIA